ncbi:MAG TPA: hypothetical protein VM938_10045 [Acidimicrobiales bacterium]|nr:hypothetical protein [Acidimicrobiales bacterium]
MSGRAFAAATLALVVLSGCRAGVTVGVDSNADGSGRVRAVVTLDAEAARRVPDLADQLEDDDLLAAGWEVEGPQPTADGGVEVEAVKRFRSPQEATQAVEELSGPGGPFRDFRLRRTRSFLKTRTAFEGTVDLKAGLESFSDDTLRRRLGGSALGFDPADLERQVGAPLSEIVTFRVAARLPGEGGRQEWQPTLGEELQLQATAEQWNARNLAAAAFSLVTGLAALLLAALRLRHRR